jgi:hypothetical protein
LGWLELSLEQMEKQGGQPTDQFTLLGSSYGLNFLGDMFNISLRPPPRPQKCGLFIRPGVELLIVGSNCSFRGLHTETVCLVCFFIRRYNSECNTNHL